jgi:hypothetical protein
MSGLACWAALITLVSGSGSAQELRRLLDVDLSSAATVEAAGGTVRGGEFVQAGDRTGYVTNQNGEVIRFPAKGHINTQVGRIEAEITLTKDLPQGERVESYITQPYQPPNDAFSFALSTGEEAQPRFSAGVKRGGTWTWCALAPASTKAGASYQLSMEWRSRRLSLTVNGERGETTIEGGPLRMPSTLCIGNAHAESRPSIYFAIHRVRFYGTGEEEPALPLFTFSPPQTLKYAPTGGVGPCATGGAVLDWDRDGRWDLVTGASWLKNLGREHRDCILLAAPEPTGLELRRGGWLRFGDLDGDALTDLVVAAREGFDWYEDTTAEGARQFEFRQTLIDAGSGEVLEPFEWGEGAPSVDFADWDNDGRIDLFVGTRSNISKYWPTGPHGGVGFGIGFFEDTWIGGETHGTVYFHRNVGTNEEPRFTRGHHVSAGPVGQAIVLYDQASVTVCDLDDDAVLDLVVASLDTVIHFRNTGARDEPRLDAGRLLEVAGRTDFPFERNRIEVVTDDDNHNALVAFGSFARFVPNSGAKGDPAYERIEPIYQREANVSSGHFSVPDACDWDADGDQDLIVGSEDGFIWLIENIDPNGGLDRWDEPVPLVADGEPLRLYSPLGLQGPCEGKWGYTNPCVADWDLDGDLDLIAGWIREEYRYWENVGSPKEPNLASRGPLAAGGVPLHVAWRTRPAVGDIDGDGLPDLIGINGAGNIAWWPRARAGNGFDLAAPKEIVDPNGQTYHVTGVGRGTGRTKLAACDWDGDGRCDIFANLRHLRNVSEGDRIAFEQQPDIAAPAPGGRWGHYSMIEPVDWNGDGNWEMVAGRDTGYIYYFGEVKVQ